MASKGKAITKARTKVREIIPQGAPTDFSDAISSIERDLNTHRIGTFRINAKDTGTPMYPNTRNRTAIMLVENSSLLSSVRIAV